MILIAVLWITSVILLLLIPYSIALFYQRCFKRNTYPYLFLISLFLYIASSIRYFYPLWGDVFFALGGVLLGCASLRLLQVMTRRWK